MLWRVALAITVITCVLLYSLLPLDSDLVRFAFAGLAFGLVSRTLAVLINSIVSAQTLILFRLKQSTLRIGRGDVEAVTGSTTGERKEQVKHEQVKHERQW